MLNIYKKSVIVTGFIGGIGCILFASQTKPEPKKPTYVNKTDIFKDILNKSKEYHDNYLNKGLYDKETVILKYVRRQYTPQDKILFIHGANGSGKHTTLFQTIYNYHRQYNVIYVPIDYSVEGSKIDEHTFDFHQDICDKIGLQGLPTKLSRFNEGNKMLFDIFGIKKTFCYPEQHQPSLGGFSDCSPPTVVFDIKNNYMYSIFFKDIISISKHMREKGIANTIIVIDGGNELFDDQQDLLKNDSSNPYRNELELLYFSDWTIDEAADFLKNNGMKDNDNSGFKTLFDQIGTKIGTLKTYLEKSKSGIE